MKKILFLLFACSIGFSSNAQIGGRIIDDGVQSNPYYCYESGFEDGKIHGEYLVADLLISHPEWGETGMSDEFDMTVFLHRAWSSQYVTNYNNLCIDGQKSSDPMMADYWRGRYNGFANGFWLGHMYF